MTMKPKAWADSLLVAYVDNELDSVQRAAVEEAIRDDAEAQAIVSVLRKSASAVKSAFDEPMSAPVPQRLLDAVGAGPGRLTDSKSDVVVPFKRNHAAPALSRVLLPLAASLAALAIGFGAGIGYDSGNGRYMPAGLESGMFEATLFQALEQGDAGVEFDYGDAQNDISGTVLVIGEIATSFGGSCREFRHSLAGALGRIEYGVACLGADNAWQVLTIQTRRSS